MEAIIMGENLCGYSDEELVAAYLRHGSQTPAGEELGVSRETVARAVRRAGIPMNGRRLNNKGHRAGGGSPRKISDAELMEESKTMTRAEIAKKHGMTICNIDRKLHRLGIKCVQDDVWLGKYLQRIDAAGYGAECDPSITLDKVMQRDGGICQICGKPVDKNDRQPGRVGNMYPTIDHIVPISRGGAHTWDNVQLSHMICNSIKGVEVV